MSKVGTSNASDEGLLGVITKGYYMRKGLLGVIIRGYYIHEKLPSILAYVPFVPVGIYIYIYI